MNNIHPVSESDYPRILEIWESSVRATHHFLKEEDIQLFKKWIPLHYLKAVELSGISDEEGYLWGFSGVSGQSLEMLFIHADMRGKGFGKQLMMHAIDNHHINKVDVNEDNPEAIGFYQHFGFKVIGRSELDGSGKPYPILHLERKQGSHGDREDHGEMDSDI